MQGVVMKNIILIIAIALIMTGCTNKDDAQRALKYEGFTNIQVTGFNFFGCSKDDFYHTGFIATNKNGVSVEGTVCSGLLSKNATVRW